MDIHEFLDSELGSSSNQSLKPLRLGPESTAIMLFDGEIETVALHYEEDEALRSYVVCPGRACPLCYLGNAPDKSGLVAVLNVDEREVQVLRISRSKKVGSLASLLRPHFGRNDTADNLILVSRNGPRYSVVVQQLDECADRCTDAIEAFIAARKDGLMLASAYPQPSAAELCEIERVHAKLQNRKGYVPPSGDVEASTQVE